MHRVHVQVREQFSITSPLPAQIKIHTICTYCINMVQNFQWLSFHILVTNICSGLSMQNQTGCALNLSSSLPKLKACHRETSCLFTHENEGNFSRTIWGRVTFQNNNYKLSRMLANESETLTSNNLKLSIFSPSQSLLILNTAKYFHALPHLVCSMTLLKSALEYEKTGANRA